MFVRSLFVFLFLFGYFSVCAQNIPFEKDPNRNVTVTYEQLIDFYKEITQNDPRAKLTEIGQTDVGKPLHVLILSADQDFDPLSIKQKNKAVMFINNGIHPGEPEGIDASMMFVRDLLTKETLSKDVVICVIPVYNVAGMLNRGVSRVNQNGPEAYGFRGSAQNYDLNRDFIKGDTRNSQLFQKIFNTWDPDVFIDTHTSNGADYQYVMTLIATQKDKLSSPLSALMEEQFTQVLYDRMAASGFPMIPYVDTKGETPASGLVSFLESPRYSTGFAALHHTIGYMPETHMWKPYAQRVQSTYLLIQHLLDITIQQKDALLGARRRIKDSVRRQEYFPISWNLDTTNVDSITFLGYEPGHKKSEVSGQERLYYDRDKLTNLRIPYYNRYTAELVIKKPKAYILPQSYEKAVDLLQLNGVSMTQLLKDTLIEADMYYITSYKTSSTPYEGHYVHHSVEVTSKSLEKMFYAGDWIIPMDQTTNRYIIETLEPQATDSFFNWNFFDAILSQKEYFSPYIFEEEATRLLLENPAWRNELEEAKRKDMALASNGRAQLEWVYKKSMYYEQSHLRYPVARLLK